MNLPDGTVLWLALDGKPVGTITLRGGSGTMATYNMGRFGVRRDSVQVFSSLPDASHFQQILVGGAFAWVDEIRAGPTPSGRTRDRPSVHAAPDAAPNAQPRESGGNARARFSTRRGAGDLDRIRVTEIA